jgi:hypothetical protein
MMKAKYVTSMVMVSWSSWLWPDSRGWLVTLTPLQLTLTLLTPLTLLPLSAASTARRDGRGVAIVVDDSSRVTAIAVTVGLHGTLCDLLGGDDLDRDLTQIIEDDFALTLTTEGRV